MELQFFLTKKVEGGNKMLFLSKNLKKYRVLKNFTQEDIANYLNITPQSVSKWERGESYPDITFLPALSNLLDTSIDLLIGMDTMRAEQTYQDIHRSATDFEREGAYSSAEAVYRNALRVYPNKPDMLLGLAGVLALQGKSPEAIEYMEKGLPLSSNEKQKATSRAILCFLYLKCGKSEKANTLASTLPHMRESREVIQPLIQKGLSEMEIDENIKTLMFGKISSNI